MDGAGLRLIPFAKQIEIPEHLLDCDMSRAQQCFYCMPIFSRLLRSIRKQGLAVSLYKAWAILADRYFDFENGVETCSHAQLPQLQISSENRAHGRTYQGSRVLPLKGFLRSLVPHLPPGCVLLDYGSGKGRVLFIAARFPFASVRGIEFSPELCAIATRNRAVFEAKHRGLAKIEVIETDAVNYVVRPDECLFYFGNPFDETIMRQAIDRIADSLRQHPRRIFIAYLQPTCLQLFEDATWLHRSRLASFHGYEFALFSNEPDTDSAPT